jgi:hypothetical protein
MFFGIMKPSHASYVEGGILDVNKETGERLVYFDVPSSFNAQDANTYEYTEGEYMSIIHPYAGQMILTNFPTQATYILDPHNTKPFMVINNNYEPAPLVYLTSFPDLEDSK